MNNIIKFRPEQPKKPKKKFYRNTDPTTETTAESEPGADDGAADASSCENNQEEKNIIGPQEDKKHI